MPSEMHSASGIERIEVVTGVERRRRWSLSEKLKAVEESEESGEPGKTVSYVARSIVFLQACCPAGESSWLKEDKRQCVPTMPWCLAEGWELKRRIRELERVLGKKTMENEILTEAVKLAHEKN